MLIETFIILLLHSNAFSNVSRILILLPSCSHKMILSFVLHIFFLVRYGELTPLVICCSKTVYMSSILLCDYEKHQDAQSPQQMDEIMSIKVMKQINLLSAAV